MSNEADLDRYISLRRIDRKHWDWTVRIPDKGYKNCEEWAPNETVARDEAREAARRLLDGDD
ncbi:hypothetical protein [Bordetella hinzii]|uniref:DUF2188 domain-containing protein n=1 Tax=Bordetella hinzii OH87 BAL007II TaxID=1331262 RepID=A0ABR4R2X4_9BORD|nr:hypothetical protein [Bordetella hinzii]KCB25083.1 hypothetical protein L544_1074 [Bordetella hinzii OH87 BAL007II]